MSFREIVFLSVDEYESLKKDRLKLKESGKNSECLACEKRKTDELAAGSEENTSTAQFGAGAAAEDFDKVIIAEERNKVVTPSVEISPTPSGIQKALINEARSNFQTPSATDPTPEATCSSTTYNPLSHLKRAHHRVMGRKFLRRMQDHQFSWDSEGNVCHGGRPIAGAKIHSLLPLVYVGVRESKLPGEDEFFRLLAKANLMHFCLTVKKNKKDWYKVFKNRRV